MGCAASKRIEAAVDVHRPVVSSFALFDINSIKEPWLELDDARQHQQLHREKPTHVPAPLLEKLNAIEDAPRTWDEVSKALEDIKPALKSPAPPPPNPNPVVHHPPAQDSTAHPNKDKQQTPRKRFSFHTLEELDAKLAPKPTELKKTESMRTVLNKNEFKQSDSSKTELRKSDASKIESGVGFLDGCKPVTENIFIVRDRLERHKDGKAANPVKRDPLSDYPAKCPPGGADSVVLYTTSLGGVRRTYEDCNKLRTILESHRVVFDERDVSLHGEFRNELRELLGEVVSVPRMFVKGRYVGGVEEVVSLNETGRLGRMMSWARVEKGVGRQGCEGCGGARFVPCLECSGSCKVLVGDNKERCSHCNENGLVHCLACLSF